MKAMIFAAGLGTRLKPFTYTAPKALFPIAGKPLLYHIIHQLKKYGFDEIIINVHHFARLIIEYLESENNFGLNIQISDEQNLLLDTGGGIKKAAAFFSSGEPFLVHNVDIISNADLGEFYRFHQKQTNALASLLIKDRETNRYLLWDEKSRLAGWTNIITKEVKPISSINPEDYRKRAFSGIHILSPRVFTYMKDQAEKFSIIDFYLSILHQSNIYGYEPANFQMVDVGKPDNRILAEELIQKLNK
ncbi:MAG: NTP transferase domain-containing protein [Candidatus Azobacteroides sp.]|nr:NTP transferase domain-containing protein [Candidatus Azobacteroides sp.]